MIDKPKISPARVKYQPGEVLLGIFGSFGAVSCCYVDAILDFIPCIIKEMNGDRAVVWAQTALVLALGLFVNIVWYIVTLCRD